MSSLKTGEPDGKPEAFTPDPLVLKSQEIGKPDSPLKLVDKMTCWENGPIPASLKAWTMTEYVVAFDNPVRISCCSSDEISAEGTSFIEYNFSIREGSFVGGTNITFEGEEDIEFDEEEEDTDTSARLDSWLEEDESDAVKEVVAEAGDDKTRYPTRYPFSCPFQWSLGGGFHLMTITVDPIDSAEMSVGGNEGASGFVTNFTIAEKGPLPYEFLLIILRE